MARVILENNLWVLVAVGLSLLELQEGYRLYKEYSWVHRRQRWVKIFLIGSYTLCTVALLIIVVCNGTILAFVEHRMSAEELECPVCGETMEAKENGLDPYRYLVWILQNAPGMSRTRPDWAAEFLPENAPPACRAPKTEN